MGFHAALRSRDGCPHKLAQAKQSHADTRSSKGELVDGSRTFLATVDG